ncbi:hypothetical protein PCAR4_450103 [Paraburkholderia caribensis]|nr:hypothetical protein PCAR4_450103 [Paraburkholderia caribensis]
MLNHKNTGTNFYSNVWNRTHKSRVCDVPQACIGSMICRSAFNRTPVIPSRETKCHARPAGA